MSAVEIVTLFGDTIVDTRHLVDPSPRRIRPATVALIASGVAALALALILFILSFYRIVPLGDLLVALFLGGGPAALIAGLLRRAEEARPRDFTIGSDPSASLHVAASEIGHRAFPLVRATGTSFELWFTGAMKGDATVDGVAIALSDLIASGRASSADLAGAYALPIGEHTRARIDLGHTGFVVSAVPAPRRYPVPLRFDRPALSYLGGTFGAGALFLALIFSLPPDRRTLAVDGTSPAYRLGKWTFKAAQPEDPLDKFRAAGKDQAGGAKGKAMAGTAGQMGNPNSTHHAGHFSIKGPAGNVDLHLAQKSAADLARSTGVLGILRADNGSLFASVLSRDHSALGDSPDNVMGNLIGAETADAYGPGGYDLVGHGPGGGGDGLGTVGVGPHGGIGPGGGGGTRSGIGPGPGGLHGYKPKTLDSAPSLAVTVTPGYGKDVIRRVVHQHLPEVKYCYEKELGRSPNLYGRVVVQFTIAGMGQVVGSVIERSTMSSPPVEQCINAAVRRWTFPKPPSGIVQVSYPFTLKSAGSPE